MEPQRPNSLAGFTEIPDDSDLVATPGSSHFTERPEPASYLLYGHGQLQRGQTRSRVDGMESQRRNSLAGLRERPDYSVLTANEYFVGSTEGPEPERYTTSGQHQLRSRQAQSRVDAIERQRHRPSVTLPLWVERMWCLSPGHRPFLVPLVQDYFDAVGRRQRTSWNGSARTSEHIDSAENQGHNDSTGTLRRGGFPESSGQRNSTQSPEINNILQLPNPNYVFGTPPHATLDPAILHQRELRNLPAEHLSSRPINANDPLGPAPNFLPPYPDPRKYPRLPRVGRCELCSSVFLTGLEEHFFSIPHNSVFHHLIEGYDMTDHEMDRQFLARCRRHYRFKPMLSWLNETLHTQQTVKGKTAVKKVMVKFQRMLLWEKHQERQSRFRKAKRVLRRTLLLCRCVFRWRIFVSRSRQERKKLRKGKTRGINTANQRRRMS